MRVVGEALLHHGPSTVSFFKSCTSLQFPDGSAIVEFHPGAGTGGRSVAPAPYDAPKISVR
jgi:hypothetical protein